MTEEAAMQFIAGISAGMVITALVVVAVYAMFKRRPAEPMNDPAPRRHVADNTRRPDDGNDGIEVTR